jgi:hypothetical protein
MEFCGKFRRLIVRLLLYLTMLCIRETNVAATRSGLGVSAAKPSVVFGDENNAGLGPGTSLKFQKRRSKIILAVGCVA